LFEDFVNTAGEIILESESSFCESCSNIILRFKELFPKKKLVFGGYYGDKNSRYSKDGIVFELTQPKNSKVCRNELQGL
jgi:hypothetical protein